MSNAITSIKEIAHGSFATIYVGLYGNNLVIAVKDFKNSISTPEAISEIIFYQTH